MSDKIFVTQPFLPPLNEYLPYLEEIWANKVLTNSGPFHQQLESKLAEYLGVAQISLFTNATIGLITALQALEVKGEVITTPFSFIATSHALLWNGIKPIFVDIDKATLNNDISKIERAITEHTSAIMPVHCYGVPCDVEAIQKIADKYNLKVIYDAAHAFGVKDNQGSILNHGDLSVLSFHATKVFNTFEGGAIVSPNADIKKRVDQLKNFGITDEVTVVAPGINGKMSEINAAFGLLQLNYIDDLIARRKQIDNLYHQGLSKAKGIRFMPEDSAVQANYSYMPILVDETYHLSRDQLYEKLKEHGIFSRRYFYPLISSFSMYSSIPSAHPSNLPVAVQEAEKILCLPIYPSLTDDNIMRICELISNS
jgi:dTDP-4-amino-4,6-dideoxygalactose transaminase